MVSVVGIDHLVIRVSDYRKSKAFYSRLFTFLGFEVDFRTAQLYAARFPADRAMTDLDQWHAFEQDRPYTFAGMYRFWVQKPA